MIKLNNKGMAMIAAVSTAIIFLGLVLTVTLVATSTHKKTIQSSDRMTALSLAEAGINDALYRMNYQHYGGGIAVYPNDGDYLDPDTTLADAWTSSTTLNNPFNLPASNGYQVKFVVDIGPPVIHKLVSTGIYNRKRRVITANIRGSNASGTVLNGPTQGISEAFNKHVIYADTVSGTGATVTGNIARMNIANISSAAANYTVTTVPSPLFNPPTPDAPTDLPTYLGDQDVYRESALGVAELNGGALPAGVTYDNVTDTFIFGALYARTLRVYVRASAEGSPPNNGNATINGATIQNFLKADGTITIQATSTFSGTDTALNPLSGTITITPAITITGNLIVKGASLTLNNVIVNGNVVSDGDITFSGASSTIDASTATDTQPAILVKASGAAAITISSSPTIILRPGQNAAVMCYSTGGATVNVTDNLTPTYNDTNGAQAAIVAYSSGGTANVNIGSGGAVTIDEATSGVPGRGRLIYSDGTGGGITLNTTGTVYGILVTNKTVTLTSGTLEYDASLFVNPPNNDFATDVYRGFSGGRRVYLPVPGSWKEK
ncbi:MAG: hypothetical protein V2A65_00405 [Candidatus Omnitrophota bacterium]